MSIMQILLTKMKLNIAINQDASNRNHPGFEKVGNPGTLNYLLWRVN